VEEGIPSNQQKVLRLCFLGTQLEDGYTLALSLVIKSRGLMKVFEKTVTGNITISLKLERSGIIANLKAKIHDRKRIPAYQQRLFFLGTQLEDGYTLADYFIKKESTLHLAVKSSIRMPILIKTLTGKTVSVEVNSSEAIGKH
ncbi:polyubiquitin 11, partial [Tanacetum coccineum]